MPVLEVPVSDMCAPNCCLARRLRYHADFPDQGGGNDYEQFFIARCFSGREQFRGRSDDHTSNPRSTRIRRTSIRISSITS
jgi:hypothetical protein